MAPGPSSVLGGHPVQRLRPTIGLSHQGIRTRSRSTPPPICWSVTSEPSSTIPCGGSTRPGRPPTHLLTYPSASDRTTRSHSRPPFAASTSSFTTPWHRQAWPPPTLTTGWTAPGPRALPRAVPHRCCRRRWTAFGASDQQFRYAQGQTMLALSAW